MIIIVDQQFTILVAPHDKLEEMPFELGKEVRQCVDRSVQEAQEVGSLGGLKENDVSVSELEFRAFFEDAMAQKGSKCERVGSWKEDCFSEYG